MNLNNTLENYLSAVHLRNPEVCLNHIWSFDPDCSLTCRRPFSCSSGFQRTPRCCRNNATLQNLDIHRQHWFVSLSPPSAVYQGLFWGALLIWAVREKDTHAAGPDHISLTSVICACLSGTRQHHRRETDTLQREIEPTPLYLKGGVQVCCCIIQTCTYSVGCAGEPRNTHTHTRKLIHIPAVRRASVISRWGLYLPLSSDSWEFYLKPKPCTDLSR